MITLLAVTTTSDSFPTLRFATDMVRDLEAQLIVVISDGTGSETGDQSPDALSRFRREKLLLGRIEEAGINLPAEYGLEFSYRSQEESIRYGYRLYHPNFTIVSWESENSTIQSLLSSTLGDLILLPGNTEYQPIRTIALGYTAEILPYAACLHPLIKLAKASEASIQVIEFDHIKPLVVPEAYQANLNLECLLETIPHQFHFSQREDMVQGILNYLDQHEVHLLALLVNQPFPNNVDPFQRVIETAAQHFNIPILVIRT